MLSATKYLYVTPLHFFPTRKLAHEDCAPLKVQPQAISVIHCVHILMEKSGNVSSYVTGNKLMMSERKKSVFIGVCRYLQVNSATPILPTLKRGLVSEKDTY